MLVEQTMATASLVMINEQLAKLKQTKLLVKTSGIKMKPNQYMEKLTEVAK